ncbi:MAG: glycosyltransferase involved in cell wall biosynthesis [Psychroserpens sp.]|jgi:glycosyltransferase involved in cell wall biosynthesis
MLDIKPPFFSIIIPTYNVEALLPRTLKSVLCQDFEDMEVILMDGDSSDLTVAIANRKSNKDSRVKVFSEKDNGIYDAMNKAIGIATGDYLFFLGSDDVFYDHTILSQVYSSLSQNPVEVLYGNVYSDRFNGIYNGEFSKEKLFFKNICHQSIFFSKTVFLKTGLFNLKYKAHADYDHNLKWFLNKAITFRYEEIIIANYADGGFSSLHGDPVFKKNKKLLFLRRSFGQVSIKFLLKIMLPKLVYKGGRVFSIVKGFMNVDLFKTKNT